MRYVVNTWPGWKKFSYKSQWKYFWGKKKALMYVEKQTTFDSRVFLYKKTLNGSLILISESQQGLTVRYKE